MRKQLGIVNAYTMEASFMGADQVRDRHFFIISILRVRYLQHEDIIFGANGIVHISCPAGCASYSSNNAAAWLMPSTAAGGP